MIYINNLEDSKEERTFYKNFKSHKYKTSESGRLDFIIAMALFKGNFEGALNYIEESIKENEEEYIKLTDDLKNYSLYTSIRNNQVINPIEMITVEQLKMIEVKAKAKFSITEQFITILLANLPILRKFQNENPDYTPNTDASVKEFWDYIVN